MGKPIDYVIHADNKGVDKRQIMSHIMRKPVFSYAKQQ